MIKKYSSILKIINIINGQNNSIYISAGEDLEVKVWDIDKKMCIFKFLK